MARKKFPIFWTLMLVVAVVWLLNELKVLAINIPWLPVILIVIAIGMIINRYQD